MFVENKVAIITGGASGIGLRYAEELLRNSLRAVTLADADATKGEQAVAQISEDFGADKVLFVQTDVTDKNQLEGKKGTIYGCLLAMEEYLPKYKSNDEGLIVNIASVVGFKGLPFLPFYTATKHAIIGLAKSLGTPDHYETTKVRVVTICPGATDTPLMQELNKKVLNDRYLKVLNKVVTEKGGFMLQNVNAVPKCLLKAAEEGANGSIWIVKTGEIYEVEIPENEQMRK